MSNVFTLDSLREEADKEFKPFKLPLSDGSEVTLRNLLRLNQKTREAVLEAVEALNGDGDINAMIDQATKVVELVADSGGKKLLKEVDGDIALLMQVIKTWMGETQLGEAENSPESSTDTASS